MSGFCGFLFFEGRVAEQARLAAMLQRLTHRGPHAAGIWCKGPVGMAHCALWNSTEATRESHPLHSMDGSLTIVADARIDNRPELSDALGLTAREAAEMGDSAFILRSYQKWGENCSAKLLGDFAFAIWDDPKRRLFCARDLFGSRPLCYHQSTAGFFFASEPKALLVLREIPDRLNEARIADYLIQRTEAVDSVSTFYDAISKMPPAHSMIVERRSTRLSRYWEPDDVLEIRHSDDRAYEDQFRELFTEAVRCSLRSASGAGCMMSGGIDSAAVACVARDLVTRDGAAFPVFSGLSDDAEDRFEQPFIRAVLETGGFEAHAYRPSDVASFLPDLERLIESADDLFAFNLADLRLVLYAATRNRGLHVLLDGTDGDIVTSLDWEMLGDLSLEGAWVHAWREARGFGHFYREYKESAAVMFWQYAVKPLAPTWARRIRRTLARHEGWRERIDGSIINPDFAERVGIAERIDRRFPVYQVRPTARQRRALVLKSSLLPVALERYDRVAALCSIEPRHPFLDRRLVEYCLALPLEQKVRSGWTKSILRRSLGNIVPDLVRWRIPTDDLHWRFLLAFMSLERERIDDMLASGLREVSGYVDQDAVRSAYDAWRRTNTRELAWKIWPVVTLIWWHSGAMKRYREAPSHG